MTDNEKHDRSLKGETGHFEFTGQDVNLTLTVIRKAVEMNWPLLTVYGIITGISIVASYFTSGWTSVEVTLAADVITFVVGLYMVKQVITITKEIR